MYLLSSSIFHFSNTLPLCFSCCPALGQMTEKNNTKRKILFWFTGSEVSEQNPCASFLWFPSEAKHANSQNVWRRRLLTSLLSGSRVPWKKGPEPTHILQRQTPSMLVPSTRPPLDRSSTFSFIQILNLSMHHTNFWKRAFEIYCSLEKLSMTHSESMFTNPVGVSQPQVDNQC